MSLSGSNCNISITDWSVQSRQPPCRSRGMATHSLHNNNRMWDYKAVTGTILSTMNSITSCMNLITPHVHMHDIIIDVHAGKQLTLDLYPSAV